MNILVTIWVCISKVCVCLYMANIHTYVGCKCFTYIQVWTVLLTKKSIRHVHFRFITIECKHVNWFYSIIYNTSTHTYILQHIHTYVFSNIYTYNLTNLFIHQKIEELYSNQHKPYGNGPNYKLSSMNMISALIKQREAEIESRTNS